ncbi:hypothetical protein LTR08_002692 [Meristemomyces frigidus]|nr:hypothetical protein LTR08_002692 [Meristemomyces frigidus]
MATFAKSTFSASTYATFRPSYPASLFNTVIAYHRGPKRLCLDLGCGPGNVTREMSRHFDRVVGTDPSPGMIAQARASISGTEMGKYSHVEFREGFAESTSDVGEGEVDMVVAGQAAHWFDFGRLWPEMRRLVRKEGTVAFWGYKDHVFVDYPEATRLLQEYAYGEHPDKLGSYWSQPGRSYLQDQLRVVRPPAEEWSDVQRVEYEPGTKGKGSGEGVVSMEKALTVGEVKAYMRTWSSYHGWREAHPQRTARGQGGDGDVVDQLVDEIAEGAAHFRDEGSVVNVEWGSSLVMARKR